MSDPTRHPTAPAARARAALRGLSVPPTDPAFRERLRREFVSGAIAPPERRIVRPPTWRRPAFARFALPLAAAAALAVVSVLDRAPRWEVVAWTGVGSVLVDGTEVPSDDRLALTARLRPGARVELRGEAEIALRGGRVLSLVATPGTVFEVPSLPRRWSVRTGHAGIEQGEIRLTTGRGFTGARLEVVTAEARVEVTGTTLAVIRQPVGTCVCLLDGHVRMAPVGGAFQPLDPGRRRFHYNDGRPVFEEPILPMERMKLEMLRDRERVTLGKAGWRAPSDPDPAAPAR